MGKQFENVSGQYGAPMGQREWGTVANLTARTVRLFRVRLDSGGYDDGGAYWGTGEPLWCAEDPGGGYRKFVRAHNRETAAVKLGILDKLARRVRPVLQVWIDREWRYVFCHNRNGIVTTADRAKALPATDKTFFENRYADRAFRVEG